MRWPRRSRVSTVAVLLAVGIASGAVWWLTRSRDVAPPDPELSSNRLPDTWSIEEIAKASPPCSYGTEGVYVLAWKIEDVGGRVKVESCLVMRILPKDNEHGQWHLSSLYRHPDDKSPEWDVSRVHAFEYGWISHSMRFKNHPTNKDLYAACDESLRGGVSWSFAPYPIPNSRILDCGVCEQNWQKVTGEKPTQFFQR